jgi:hypothetical protein
MGGGGILFVEWLLYNYYLALCLLLNINELPAKIETTTNALITDNPRRLNDRVEGRIAHRESDSPHF